jgi:hypothetical protein
MVSAGVPPSGPSVDLYMTDRPRGPCTKTPPESNGRSLSTSPAQTQSKATRRSDTDGTLLQQPIDCRVVSGPMDRQQPL